MIESRIVNKLELVLPYPPSVNTYWRRNGTRYFVSPAGQRFQANVLAALTPVRFNRFGPSCRLAVKIDLFPPDNKRRDIDNSLKGLLDSLVTGGVIADDSQIDDLWVVRRGVRKGGAAVVRIREILGKPRNARERL